MWVFDGYERVVEAVVDDFGFGAVNRVYKWFVWGLCYCSVVSTSHQLTGKLGTAMLAVLISWVRIQRIP